MYKFVEKKNGKVWFEKGTTYLEAKARILKILGYKPTTQVMRHKFNTYVIG